MSGRVWNFSAGPCTLPLEVLEKAQRELVEWNGAGMSVLEMSHRSKDYVGIFTKAQADLKEIMSIPDPYKVLFLQGGATLQFAGVPFNMLGGEGSNKMDYLVTGQWSEKAFLEAKKYGDPSAVVNTKDSKFTTVPLYEAYASSLNPSAKFLHYCDNETVNGVEFAYVPESKVPLVCDMSSNFMSRPVQWDKFSVVYAGAQKNLGPAGVTVVIASPDYCDGSKELPICPSFTSYKLQAGADSMYNTPACYSVYVIGLCLQYTKEKGGLSYWEEQSALKSGMLYDAIEGSDGFYTAPVDKGCRSRMNVPFQIQGGNVELEKKFLEEAKKHKLTTLAGHRSVGGIRASLYNGMPAEGVRVLVDFMKMFAEENR